MKLLRVVVVLSRAVRSTNRLSCLSAITLALPLLCGQPVRAQDTGASVVVVFNSLLKDSQPVAEHYAQRRGVPARQVIGLPLPGTESITRAEFVEKLEKPLRQLLEVKQLITFGPGDAESKGGRKVIAATIRYVVLSYGVPLKILNDPALIEEGTEKLPPELRRTEAAVDSQLALLPLSEQHLPWAGPLNNRFYGATNSLYLHPTNGILMVTRLAGPRPEIARALVDKALEAETNGLWGRAYIDARGFTNGAYVQGDQWMRGAAVVCRRTGFTTDLDENPATYPAGFPMSQIAIYCGWYDGSPSGPFTRPQVEFMPGAIAYHLHSFSAHSIREHDGTWVRGLLEKGATATLGCTEEPYLGGSPDVTVLIGRLLFFRTTFGEAAYAAQPALSWQTTVVGDPLYRPFARSPKDLLGELEQRHSPLLAWWHERIVNLNLAQGYPPDDALAYLESIPLAKQSAVLMEKLGDLQVAKKKVDEALSAYERAVKLDPSPQQKIRLLLTLARLRTVHGPDLAAFTAYERILSSNPDYPDALALYQQMLLLAQKMGKPGEVERVGREIQRRTEKTEKK